jgi:hypothetical protein
MPWWRRVADESTRLVPAVEGLLLHLATQMRIERSGEKRVHGLVEDRPKGGPHRRRRRDGDVGRGCGGRGVVRKSRARKSYVVRRRSSKARRRIYFEGLIG